MDTQQFKWSEEQAQRIVRESYGAVIPKDMRVAESLYHAAEIDWLPESVKTYALGLGNPVRYAELQPGEVVLDVGSGAGIDTFIAAKKVGPTGHVIGLDMTPETLSIYLANFRFTKPDAWNLAHRGLQSERAEVK